MQKKGKNKRIVWIIGGTILILCSAFYIIFCLKQLGIFRMGGSGICSMYLYNDTLYYSGKSGGIYRYSKDVGSDLLVKRTDGYFGARDSYIYYTYKGNNYCFNLNTNETEKTEDFSEEIPILYAHGYYNSDEVEEIFRTHEEIFWDSPFGIYDGKDTLYVSHNESGGYLKVYNVSWNNGKTVITENSGKISEGSNTFGQVFMLGMQDALPIHFLSNGILEILVVVIAFFSGMIILVVQIKKGKKGQ